MYIVPCWLPVPLLLLWLLLFLLLLLFCVDVTQTKKWKWQKMPNSCWLLYIASLVFISVFISVFFFGCNFSLPLSLAIHRTKLRECYTKIEHMLTLCTVQCDLNDFKINIMCGLLDYIDAFLMLSKSIE